MSKHKKFRGMLDLWSIMWANFGTMGKLNRQHTTAELEKWAKNYVNQTYEEDQDWKDLTK